MPMNGLIKYTLLTAYRQVPYAATYDHQRRTSGVVIRQQLRSGLANAFRQR